MVKPVAELIVPLRLKVLNRGEVVDFLTRPVTGVFELNVLWAEMSPPESVRPERIAPVASIVPVAGVTGDPETV